MLIKALGSHLAVEGLDKHVVRRLSWTREIKYDPVGIGPHIHFLGHQLRTLVYPDPLGLSVALHGLPQGGHHVYRFEALSDLYSRTHPAKVIHYR